jgi:hypothetical protein
MGRGQCGNTPYLGHAAGARDVGLRDIECTPLEQILAERVGSAGSRKRGLKRENPVCFAVRESCVA